MKSLIILLKKSNNSGDLAKNSIIVYLCANESWFVFLPRDLEARTLNNINDEFLTDQSSYENPSIEIMKP